MRGEIEDTAIRRLVLSALGHTWILDLDGTIVKHNGYKTDGYDTFVAGAREFLERIPPEDMILFLTSRPLKEKEKTECFLRENGIRYHSIIYEAPHGERILINDRKPSGLSTTALIEKERDARLDVEITIDERL